MDAEVDRLRQLAQRVSDGEVNAAKEFVRELEPRMTRMVLCVMDCQAPRSILTRRILSEVARAKAGALPPDRNALATQVARCICDSVIERLRHRPDRWSTVLETVLL